MDYRESKLKYFPKVPPKEHRQPGIHPMVKGKEHGTWYATIRDKRRLALGHASDRFTVSRDTYWEACEARLTYLADMNDGVAPPPAPAAKPIPAPKADAARASLYMMLDAYIKLSSAAPSDVPQVQTIMNELCQKRADGEELMMSEIGLQWAEDWVASMKAKRVTPNTIKKKVDCLKRAIDWSINRDAKLRIKAGVPEQTVLREKPINPLKHLDKGYQKYRSLELDRGEEAPENSERDRRLEPLEDELIQATIKGEYFLLRKPSMPTGKAFATDNREALYVLYMLLTNTAMRLREGYTLQRFQVQIRGESSQIILPKDRTKTSSPRSFPIPPEILPLVVSWIEAHVGDDPKALMFPMLWSGDNSLKRLAYASSLLSKKFKSIFKFAGIPVDGERKLTEHDFRHEGTCRWVERINPNTGTWAYKKEECMKYTGHKREEMFFRYMSIRGSDGGARLYLQAPKIAANDAAPKPLASFEKSLIPLVA